MSRVECTVRPAHGQFVRHISTLQHKVLAEVSRIAGEGRAFSISTLAISHAFAQMYYLVDGAGDDVAKLLDLPQNPDDYVAGLVALLQAPQVIIGGGVWLPQKSFAVNEQSKKMAQSMYSLILPLPNSIEDAECAICNGLCHISHHPDQMVQETDMAGALDCSSLTVTIDWMAPFSSQRTVCRKWRYYEDGASEKEQQISIMRSSRMVPHLITSGGHHFIRLDCRVDGNGSLAVFFGLPAENTSTSMWKLVKEATEHPTTLLCSVLEEQRGVIEIPYLDLHEHTHLPSVAESLRMPAFVPNQRVCCHGVDTFNSVPFSNGFAACTTFWREGGDAAPSPEVAPDENREGSFIADRPFLFIVAIRPENMNWVPLIFTTVTDPDRPGIMMCAPELKHE